MRLTELEPRWGIDADLVIGGVVRHYEGRHGMAVTFLCPHCRTTRLGVWLSNPLDGLPPTDDANLLWKRVAGDTFDTLTLSPSINVAAHGHWHGAITNGEVT